MKQIVSTRAVILVSTVVLCVIGMFLLGWWAFMRWGRNYPSGPNAFDTLILEYAKKNNLSPYLIKGIIKKESEFDPRAVGKAGEIGLMQITEGVVQDWERITGHKCLFDFQLFDPRLNIRIGSWYLGRARSRWNEYKHADALALAEYNAGLSRARQWAPPEVDDKVLPSVEFPGTKNYIEETLRYRELFQKKRIKEK